MYVNVSDIQFYVLLILIWQSYLTPSLSYICTSVRRLSLTLNNGRMSASREIIIISNEMNAKNEKNNKNKTIIPFLLIVSH